MKPLIALGLLCVATVCHAADECRFSAARSAAIDAAGARKIVIAAGAGDLQVRGRTGQSAVQANARACASSQELLDQIQLESRREGDVLHLKTVLPTLADSLLGFNRYATLDLNIVLPASLDAAIEDSSGDMELTNLASAVVADSSGDIEIEGIAGRLDLTDSSGDIEIENVGGPLRVHDSSGDIEIENVRGAIDITVDSSGDIHIEDVAGDVHIGNDGSGGISIRHAKGDVVIDSDSSGDIIVDDVAGKFVVGADSSGNIRHTRVQGTVQLP